MWKLQYWSTFRSNFSYLMNFYIWRRRNETKWNEAKNATKIPRPAPPTESEDWCANSSNWLGRSPWLSPLVIACNPFDWSFRRDIGHCAQFRPTLPPPTLLETLEPFKAAAANAPPQQPDLTSAKLTLSLSPLLKDSSLAMESWSNVLAVRIDGFSQERGREGGQIRKWGMHGKNKKTNSATAHGGGDGGSSSTIPICHHVGIIRIFAHEMTKSAIIYNSLCVIILVRSGFFVHRDDKKYSILLCYCLQILLQFLAREWS